MHNQSSNKKKQNDDPKKRNDEVPLVKKLIYLPLTLLELLATTLKYLLAVVYGETILFTVEKGDVNFLNNNVATLVDGKIPNDLLNVVRNNEINPKYLKTTNKHLDYVLEMTDKFLKRMKQIETALLCYKNQFENWAKTYSAKIESKFAELNATIDKNFAKVNSDISNIKSIIKNIILEPLYSISTESNPTNEDVSKIEILENEIIEPCKFKTLPIIDSNSYVFDLSDCSNQNILIEIKAKYAVSKNSHYRWGIQYSTNYVYDAINDIAIGTWENHNFINASDDIVKMNADNVLDITSRQFKITVPLLNPNEKYYLRLVHSLNRSNIDNYKRVGLIYHNNPIVIKIYKEVLNQYSL